MKSENLTALVINSTRDYDGHGSHTLSTAGGSYVSGASVFGLGVGTAKGGSPKARVAAYKVCWPLEDGGCFDADIAQAFDHAIHDRVDVLSLSLGGEPADYYDDGIAISAFHAVKKGIPVVCSAGNSGPGAQTVSNTAPWILTVGASTMDREFQAPVELQNGHRYMVRLSFHSLIECVYELYLYFVGFLYSLGFEPFKRIKGRQALSINNWS